MMDEEVRWCSSCGSPIPAGLDACPVCGMPVEGAFDEDRDLPRPKPASAPNPNMAATPLVSAIPDAPLDGTDTNIEVSRPQRRRLLLVAALAALLFVGGTTLFITRPWNPHAYDTRATEEADTSMAGFPGAMSHLSSQDRIEDVKHQQAALQGEKTLIAYREQLGRWALAVSMLYDRLDRSLDAGDASTFEGSSAESAELLQALQERTEAVRGLTLEGDDLAEERQRLLVLGGYLESECGLVAEAWRVAAAADSWQEAADQARLVMASPWEGHTRDEWHSLFVNAYVSEHV